MQLEPPTITSGRCRIVGFNARPLVFYPNVGGNVRIPPETNLWELSRELCSELFGHKKSAIESFLGYFCCTVGRFPGNEEVS